MKLLIQAEPGEAAQKAHQLLKALAQDLAPASESARAVLEALEDAEVAKSPRPLRSRTLQGLRERAAGIVHQELRQLEQDLLALAEEPEEELGKAVIPAADMVKAMFLGPRGGKWADPEHTIPWRGDEQAAPKHVKVKPHPAIGFREGVQLHYRVEEHGDQVHLISRDGEAGTIRMPKTSLRHFIDDMHGEVHEPPSDNEHVQAVISGKAKLLGKGNEGLAFHHGDKVVKVSTTVPYQPENPGHRTPEEAARQVQGEAMAAKHLRDLGVPHIPDMQLLRHGEKAFLIRDHVKIPEHLTKSELDQVAESLHAMHQQGWALNDQIQVGTKDGEVQLFDVGYAAPSSWDRIQNDRQELGRLFERNGQVYDPPLDVRELSKDPESALADISRPKFMAMMGKGKLAQGWERKAAVVFHALREKAKADFHDLPEDLADELNDLDRRQQELLEKFRAVQAGAQKGGVA